MKMKITQTFLALGVLAPMASAAPINVGLLNEEADIVNTGGATVSAVHFQNASTSGDPDPLVVNGISHTVGTGSDANLTINTTFEGDFRNGASGLPQDGSDIIQVLLSGIAGVNGLVMSVDGLTPGTEYLFQAYWEHNNSGNTIVANIEGDSLSNIAAQASTPGNPGGTLISYQFFAGDSTLNASFDRDGANANVGDLNNWLSGYSLQVVPVPEPSSLALLGLGGLLIVRRRRG